jgi:hypothetical protein
MEILLGCRVVVVPSPCDAVRIDPSSFSMPMPVDLTTAIGR